MGYVQQIKRTTRTHDTRTIAGGMLCVTGKTEEFACSIRYEEFVTAERVSSIRDLYVVDYRLAFFYPSIVVDISSLLIRHFRQNKGLSDLRNPGTFGNSTHVWLITLLLLVDARKCHRRQRRQVYTPDSQ